VNFAVSCESIVWNRSSAYPGRGLLRDCRKKVTSSTYEWVRESAPTPEKRDYRKLVQRSSDGFQTGRQIVNPEVGAPAAGRAELLDGTDFASCVAGPHRSRGARRYDRRATAKGMTSSSGASISIVWARRSRDRKPRVPADRLR